MSLFSSPWFTADILLIEGPVILRRPWFTFYNEYRTSHGAEELKILEFGLEFVERSRRLAHRHFSRKDRSLFCDHQQKALFVMNHDEQDAFLDTPSTQGVSFLCSNTSFGAEDTSVLDPDSKKLSKRQEILSCDNTTFPLDIAHSSPHDIFSFLWRSIHP
jgi:hypothetical protein